jgi:ADP-heptose:LPS heptosyltransferase
LPIFAQKQILKKILIIRFSSIGDIVLTTPLLRCLKTQLPGVEIHYLTKQKFKSVLATNPHIDFIHTIDDHLSEIIPQLKNEKFDHIIDLHKNFRSMGIRLKLRKSVSSFSKINFRKWLLVHLKINRLPDVHIVDRYFESLKYFEVKNDGKGLDYFIEENDRLAFVDLPKSYRNGFIGIVIGGMHFTKILPSEKVIALINQINKPVILLGGPEDFQRGEAIADAAKAKVLNSCGQFSLNQSASLVSLADKIITNDTGLMHIAAAFDKEIISVWGNTIPEFGMYPYLKKGSSVKNHIFQVENLNCRPCSKIGYKKCPKSHFDCMNKQNVDEMARIVNAH